MMTLQTPKPTSIEAKTEAFFKTVEAGDMALFEIIQPAIAVFGYTRAGKTASCHLLCRSTLKAEMKNGELIYVPSTKKFDTAIVGCTHESETQIPNIFDTMVKEGNSLKNIYILDQPGYGDTYGFHRIFSNGYFHYRTFSKTPKLKFVLAIGMYDLRGTAQKFKLTIKNFFNTFKDWNSIKKQVMSATCILVTKADTQTTEASLIDILKSLREAVSNMGTNQKARYQQFVDDIIKQKKIFFIPKPTQVNQRAEDTTTLQKIYDKTSFWQRPVHKNIVNMSQINFSVSAEILLKLRDKDDENFREQFEHYMAYVQRRVDGMILDHKGSLKNIVGLLQQDAKKHNDSHDFLEAMVDFNKYYYQFFESYNKRRESIISNLFKNLESEQINQSTEEQLKEMRSIYFIKKFKVLDYLIETNERIQTDGILTNRSIEQLEGFSNTFMQMFKKFSILGFTKNDKENIIYKYSYIVQRLIEESKILTLILFQSDAVRNQFEQLGVKIVSQDIFRILFDRFFTQVLGQIKLNEVKVHFVENLNFNELVTVNDQIITFLESVPQKSQDIDFKIADFIIEFQRKLFQDQNNPEIQQKKYLLKKLYTYRQKFYSFWNNLKNGGTVTMRERCSETLINITKSLANVLQSLHLYSCSRECFKTINDAESIFRIYQIEAASVSKSPQIYRNLLIDYSKEANLYYRKQLALQCCQKAYALSSNIAQIKEVSELIVGICTQKKEDMQNDPYLSRMYNFDDMFFEDFPQELIATIESECDY